MNTQPPEKQQPAHSDRSVEVHSIFQTIQGEGPFTGHRATFIRLAGCNLQCPGCDTYYTTGRTRRTPEQILAQVPSLPALVVITGGEPFRQGIHGLVEALLEAGHYVQIETNGTLFQDLPFDKITIVCSPKGTKVHPKLQPHIAALKYVLRAGNGGEDGLPITALNLPINGRLARPWPSFTGPVYLQPEDEKNQAANRNNIAAVVNSVLEFGYILQLQVHKFVNVE